MSHLEEVAGAQAHIVPLNGRRAGVLADLGAVNQDVKFVMACCARLVAALKDEDHDGVVAQALFTAAVITYARCFNTGKRTGLNESDVAKLGFDEDVLGFHRQVLDMRSKHIAHSVNPFEIISVGAILSPPEAENRKVEGIKIFTGRLITFDESGIKQLHEICKRLANLVIAKRAERLQTDALAEACEVEINELYSRQALGARVPGPETAGITRAQRGR
jgi:hypothetical protein